MSAEKDVRPFHSKAVGTGQEAADAVAAVLHHAADRDDARGHRPPPKKQPRWMLPLGINMAIFAVYLFIGQPRWSQVDPLEGPDPARAMESMRMAMYLQAQRIESYRLKNGRLPAVLDEMGASTYEDVEYVPVGGDLYRLVGTLRDTTLVYHSSDPINEWVGDAANALVGG